MYNEIKGVDPIDVHGHKCYLPIKPDDDLIQNYTKTKVDQFWVRTELPKFKARELDIFKDFKFTSSSVLTWEEANRQELIKKSGQDPQDRMKDGAWRDVTGVSFDVHYEQEAMRIFREQEYYRIINGHWFFNNGIPTYITGTHYFYLNYWTMDTGYPSYRDTDRQFFYVWEWVKDSPDILGLLLVSIRGLGKSYIMGVVAYLEALLHRNAHCGMQSKTEEDASSLLKLKVFKPIMSMPEFLLPYALRDTELTNLAQLNIDVPPRRKMNPEFYKFIKDEAPNSIIDSRSSGEFAYDGSTLRFLGQDEVGKCLAKDTPILMHDYSVKMSQDIVKGDYLMGKDLSPRKVLSVGEGESVLYNIIPSLGRSVKATGWHPLVLQYHYYEPYFIEAIEQNVEWLNTINITIEQFIQLPSMVQSRFRLIYIEYDNILPRTMPVFGGVAAELILYITTGDQSSLSEFADIYIAKVNDDPDNFLRLCSFAGVDYCRDILTRLAAILPPSDDQYSGLVIPDAKQAKWVMEIIYRAGGNFLSNDQYIFFDTDFPEAVSEFSISKDKNQSSYYGVVIDKDKRFLLASGLVTHNTEAHVCDVEERLRVNTQCVMRNTIKRGNILLTTTVEKMENGGKQCKAIWDTSGLSSDNKTESQVSRMFIGAIEASQRFIDRYGICEPMKARLYHESIRDSYKGDDGLISYIQKNPFTVEEAFSTSNKNTIFQFEILNTARNQAILYGNTPVKGDFTWITYDNEVQFIPNEDGKWMVSFLIPDHAKEYGFIPNKVGQGHSGARTPLNGRFVVGGVDPVGSKMNSELYRGSRVAATFILKDCEWVDEQYRNTVIADYLHRSNNPDDDYEEILKAAFYYGAPILIERNKTNAIDYLKHRGYGHDPSIKYGESFIMNRPESTITLSGQEGTQGMYTSTSAYNHYIESTRIFIAKHGHKLTHLRVIDELIDYKLEDALKFDLVMSTMMAILATEKVYTQAKTSIDIGRIFRPMDHSGRFSTFKSK